MYSAAISGFSASHAASIIALVAQGKQPPHSARSTEVLKLAWMGVLKLGTVALDGTKIHANASRYERVCLGVCVTQGEHRYPLP